jgi:hypothetical protein
MGTKFSRTTKGQKLQVFVATPINITDDSTYDAFVANAPLGEVGVFDASGNKHTDAITSAESFFVAQKVTGGIKRTSLYKFTDAVCRKKTYLAPVKCKYFLGWDGSGYGLNLEAAPSNGKVYEFAVLETTNAFDPLPNFNYNYTAKPGDVEMDVVQALVAQVNNYDALMYKSNSPLVNAKAKASATYGNYALTGTTPTLTVTNGSTAVVLGGGTPAIDAAVGDFISFDAAAAPTASVGDIYKIVATSATGFTLNRPYQGATQTFTEAEAEGTRVKKVTAILKTGLEITAINNDESFKLAVREELEWADINFSAYTIGNGSPDQMKELEWEGQVIAGDTAKNSEFAVNYGQQDNFATSNGTSETYDQVSVDLNPDSGLVGPTQGRTRTSIIFALPKSAGTVAASIATYFGV